MTHHGAGLLRLTRDEKLVEILKQDYRKAELKIEDATMLDYVEKLTRQLSSVSEEDIDGLRSVGFSDVAILDINQVAAYYNYVNRIADGLGVELEPYWDL
jgi:uncharacterized peroxidase-related enzyme